jgi:uncharacterized membrane protein
MRVFIAPATVAWLGYENVLHTGGTWAHFMSSPWTVGIFTFLVLVELVTDQLPSTPSRKVPKQFIPRIVSGAFSTAVLSVVSGTSTAIVLLGLIGVAVGTLGGFSFRDRLANTFNGRDRPAAIIEDIVALLLALIVAALM